MLRVLVQAEPFDVADETALLSATDPGIGAVASFIGLVRDNNTVGESKTGVATLTLEHYPGMTEKALTRIAEQAQQRWSLQAVTVVHRVGEMHVGEGIVLVLTASRHRQDAFDACQYIMDILKTEAPFWKKELLPDGSHRWVDSRDSDSKAAERWLLDDA